MPGGYSVATVRVGSRDTAAGLVVGNGDVTGVVITVSAPAHLPRMHGNIAGLANTRLTSTKIELTGPIIGSLDTSPRQDGSFEFPALTPGMYRLRLPNVPEVAPVSVVVTWNDVDVKVTVPSH